jgi:ATP-binding cassette, subfamily C, bacterial CydD
MNNAQSSAGTVGEKWLFTEALALRRTLLVSVIIAVLGGVLTIIQARVLAVACHMTVINHSDINLIIPFAGWVVCIACIRSVLSFLSEKHAAAASSELKTKVRSMLYRHIISLPPQARPMDTGSLVEAVSHGVDSLDPYISRFLPNLALAAVLPLLCLLFVLPVEWRAGLVLLFSAPFIPLFMILVGKGAEELNRRQWTRLAVMSGHLLDLIRGLPDLKICSAVKREAAALSRVSEEYRLTTMSVLRIAFLSAFTLEFFTTVGTAVVAVIVGFRLLGGELELIDGLFILIVAPEFYLPLRTLGLSYHSRMQGVAAADKIVHLLSCDGSEKQITGTLPVPSGRLSIAYENVTFRYPSGRGGVAGADLVLTPGTITALVGESGSGKSTVAWLLLGLASPQEGRVTVSGTDLCLINPLDWRSRVAWVPQSPFFFCGSIRDNLTIGLTAVDDLSIRSALDSAAALSFVERLPGGLDCQLGDRGAGLSGGELRRLAIARVFLRGADLIILDEPTAGLDRESELFVCESLKRLAAGRTVLIISHREETAGLADRVVRLVEGRVEALPSTRGSGNA